VLNAAGTLGMFLGSTLAGTLSSLLLAQGMERREAYVAVFVTAGLAQLFSVIVAVVRGRAVSEPARSSAA